MYDCMDLTHPEGGMIADAVLPGYWPWLMAGLGVIVIVVGAILGSP